MALAALGELLAQVVIDLAADDAFAAGGAHTPPTSKRMAARSSWRVAIDSA